MYFISTETRLLQKPSLAQVDEVNENRVRVNWGSTNWDADVYIQNDANQNGQISPGQSVTVIGTRGIKLVVLA